MQHRVVRVGSLLAVGALVALGCKREQAAAQPPPAAQPAVPAPEAITWNDSANARREQVGATFTYLCPPNGTPGTVWGTDTYSSDSSICGAAAHSGRITRAAGGVVQIQIAPGRPSYDGTVRGGETTRHFGSYPGSFVIVGGPTPGMVAIPVPRVNANGINIGGVQIAVGSGGAGAWSTNGVSHRGQVGTSFTVTCTPNGTLGNVWGTDIYSDDSSVCSAAVHAGRITLAQGGEVTAWVHPGRARYAGTARNGVTSRDFATFPGSFAFTAAVAPEVQLPPGVTAFSWTDSATRFRAQAGERVQVFCPPAGRLATVWGSGPFTDDSSVCTAAVFAGRITLERGGVVRLRVAPGLPQYRGGERNGVTTRDFGSFPGSFEITR